jgi:hypothetical protein
MNFIPFEVLPMGVFVNAMVSPFLNWKIIIRFSFVLRYSVDSLWARAGCQYSWAKWTDPSPKCVYRLKPGHVPQSSWWYRFAEIQTMRGNWIIVWRVRWKHIWCRMTEHPVFSNRQLKSTIGLDTFPSESRVIYQKSVFWYKIMNHNNRLIDLELMDDCILRNPVLNGADHCQNVHRVSLCPRT